MVFETILFFPNHGSLPFFCARLFSIFPIPNLRDEGAVEVARSPALSALLHSGDEIGRDSLFRVFSSFSSSAGMLRSVYGHGCAVDEFFEPIV